MYMDEFSRVGIGVEDDDERQNSLSGKKLRCPSIIFEGKMCHFGVRHHPAEGLGRISVISRSKSDGRDGESKSTLRGKHRKEGRRVMMTVNQGVHRRCREKKWRISNRCNGHRLMRDVDVRHHSVKAFRRMSMIWRSKTHGGDGESKTTLRGKPRKEGGKERKMMRRN
jgi:hypothetical protein